MHGITRKDSTNTRGLACTPRRRRILRARPYVDSLDEREGVQEVPLFAFLLTLCSCREKLLRVDSEKLLCLTNRRPFPLNRAIPVTLSPLVNPFPLYPSRCHFDSPLSSVRRNFLQYFRQGEAFAPKMLLDSYLDTTCTFVDELGIRRSTIARSSSI